MGCLQRLGQIVDDVFDIFQSNAQAHQAGVDARGAQLRVPSAVNSSAKVLVCPAVVV